MTLFEKIIARQIPADILHEDERCLVFRDINPQAPIHLLIIPKKPIPRVGEAEPADEAVLGYLLLIAGRMAETLGIRPKEKVSAW